MNVTKLWEILSDTEREKLALLVHKSDLLKTPISDVMKASSSSRLNKRLKELSMEGYLYLEDIDREDIRSKHNTNRKTVLEFDDLCDMFLQ